jgi:hypothetical protein
MVTATKQGVKKILYAFMKLAKMDSSARIIADTLIDNVFFDHYLCTLSKRVDIVYNVMSENINVTDNESVDDDCIVYSTREALEAKHDIDALKGEVELYKKMARDMEKRYHKELEKAGMYVMN